MRVICSVVTIAGMAMLPATASARNIVISNDDGLSSNVVALYNALKAAGHDVIVSVPCENQSGVGSALRLATTQVKLTAPCRSGAAAVGDPVAGPMTRKGINSADFYYVLGTPVMSVLYGVDVVAQKRWGRPPDVVIAGPNEGQNVGAVIVNSGTINVAENTAMNGIPAIAFSAGANTADDTTLANPDSAKVAKLSVTFLDSVFARASDGPVLPTGVVLNVNFPDKLEDGLSWRWARNGTYNAYVFRYVENMAAAATPAMVAMAKEHGMVLPNAPGLSVAMNDQAPTPAQADDESVVYRTAISVSPLQAGYQAPQLEDLAAWYVSGLNHGGN